MSFVSFTGWGFLQDSEPRKMHTILHLHFLACISFYNNLFFYFLFALHGCTLSLHRSEISDPRESELWLSTIRTATQSARTAEPLLFTQKMVEYTARALEQERDYDPSHFHMFKVVQRASKSGGRSSSDDLTKLTTVICILAVGMYKVHLIPLPKSTRTASNSSLSDMVGFSHGFMTLTSIYVQSFDDTFQLNFRVPLRRQCPMFLASSCVHDIALWIRHAADYLRPNFLEQPFTWNVPQSLDDELFPTLSDGEDHRYVARFAAQIGQYRGSLKSILFQYISIKIWHSGPYHGIESFESHLRGIYHLIVDTIFCTGSHLIYRLTRLFYL